VNKALQAAPRWRREPYVVFFPLGIVLSWTGVGHWLAYGFGWTLHYRAIFHSMAQVEGFLLCFAVGFLFTMIPRRTGSAPPSAWEMVVCLIAPVTTVIAAWQEWWMLSQVGWLVVCSVLVAFVLRRFLSVSSMRRPPNSFVWIPMAFLMGLAGALLTGGYAVLGEDYRWLHEVGRGLLLQGVFISLILGVGGLALPMMTRGVAPADTTATTRDRLARLGHLLAGAVLAASFFVQAQVSVAMAMGLRAAVIVVVLIAGPQLWKPPLREGWNRRAVWLSGWLLPAGFVVAALFPAQFQAGLHISFIGGFALLTLAVSTHVVLGHSGYDSLLKGRPWQVAAIAGFTVAAMAARVMMEFDYLHRLHWMACAAAFFLVATGVWAAFLVPKVIRPIE